MSKKKPLPTGGLVGTLVGAHAGPVLVCGGAPSLPADLEALRAGGFNLEKAVIVSGNEHACYAGLKPQYIVVNDHEHTVLKCYQEPRIRKIAPYAKLCSRHWWGDFRGPKMVKANSGLTAVLWAGLMGGNPVIAAGFELYRGEKSYFHNRWQMQSPSMMRPDTFMRAQVQELHKLLEHTPVRPVSGALTNTWPKWDPKEKFKRRALTTLERRLVEEAETGRLIAAAAPGNTFQNAVVAQGLSFPVTAAEAQAAGPGFVDVTDRPLDEALREQADAARREHQRLLEMIAKVRNHPRSVRRGIYDADLIRVIRWAEEGLTPLHIEKRTGLPKGQVAFLIKTMGVRCEAG